MALKDEFKKVVDEIITTVKRDDRPILMEEIAGDMSITREYFSRLYNGKHDIKPKHIKDLLLRYPEVAHITSDITLKEENVNSGLEKKTNKQVQNLLHTSKVDDLIESTRKLSDSNLINARNIDRLITMLEVSSSGASRGTSLASDPAFPRLVDLLWMIVKDSNKWEENQFRALVASTVIPGDQVHEGQGT